MMSKTNAALCATNTASDMKPPMASSVWHSPACTTAGTPYEGRLPIGSAEGIEGTTAQDLRDFYEKWYVPSNIAVIAVGHLPLDTLEALVEKHFDAIPEGEEPTAPETASALDPEPRFDIATSPGQGYSYLSLDIRLPSWDRNTVEGERQLWIEQLISIMLGNRLQDAYEQGYLSQTDPTHWRFVRPYPWFALLRHQLASRRLRNRSQ